MGATTKSARDSQHCKGCAVMERQILRRSFCNWLAISSKSRLYTFLAPHSGGFFYSVCWNKTRHFPRLCNIFYSQTKRWLFFFAEQESASRWVFCTFQTINSLKFELYFWIAKNTIKLLNNFCKHEFAIFYQIFFLRAVQNFRFPPAGRSLLSTDT